MGFSWNISSDHESCPNSPKALEKLRTRPARMPGQASGIMIRRNITPSPIPKVRAAHIRWTSTCSKAPRAERYIRGKETIIADSTVAYQVKMMLPPNAPSNDPRGPFFPNNTRRKNPSTVGGSTRGSVIAVSTIEAAVPLSFMLQRAIVVPKMKTRIVARTAARREMTKGE